MEKKPPLKTGHPETSAKKPMSRSLKIYKKVAIIFVVAAFLLLLGVLYLSISQAVIHVTPNPQVISTTVAAEITGEPVSTSQVNGVVLQETVEKGREFEVPQEGATPVEAKAGGTVTLINDTGTDQPLVATTRLLSEEGVLFRIDEAVIVPANGQVDTAAHADEPGQDGEIGPSQFTVPGLPESLQDDIYAVSVDAMAGGVQYRRVVTQEDLDQAVESLRVEILDQTKVMLREQAGEGLDGEAFDIEIVQRASDTEPGTETGLFTVSTAARVTGVFYSMDEMLNLAKAGLFNQAPDGFRVFEVNEDGLVVEVQSLGADAQTATVNVKLDGFSIISANNDILDKDRFTGKAPNQVITVLEAAESIQDVRVSFTPFWLKRVPTLEDHIKIDIDSSE